MLQPSEAVSRANVATTDRDADMSSAQVVPEPAQSPDQEDSFQPVEGDAVSVTAVPELTLEEQVPVLQSITPVATTEPVPETVTLRDCDVTVGVTDVTVGMNAAVTDWAEVMVTVQAPVPEREIGRAHV